MGNVQYLAYLGCIILYLVISRYIRYISLYPAISGPDIVKYLVQRRVGRGMAAIGSGGLYPRSGCAISPRNVGNKRVTGLTRATGVNEGFGTALRTHSWHDSWICSSPHTSPCSSTSAPPEAAPCWFCRACSWSLGISKSAGGDCCARWSTCQPGHACEAGVAGLRPHLDIAACTTAAGSAVKLRSERDALGTERRACSRRATLLESPKTGNAIVAG